MNCFDQNLESVPYFWQKYTLHMQMHNVSHQNTVELKATGEIWEVSVEVSGLFFSAVETDHPWNLSELTLNKKWPQFLFPMKLAIL